MPETIDWRDRYIEELSLRWAVEEWLDGRLTTEQLREQAREHVERDQRERSEANV